MNTKGFGRLVTGLLAFAFATVALAQSYPVRPVKVIVPYGPGTAIDIVVRRLSEVLTRSLGQPFITENRPGASGTIGTGYVATAPADGYIILSDASTHTSAPSFISNLPFDPQKDFVGVATLTDSPLVMVVAASTGYKSVADLVAAAKAKPGALTFASAGAGSSTYLTAEKFRLAAGLDMLHVPFKSSTDGLTEVMAGRVTFTYTGVASALPLTKDGRLVVLATGFKRTPALPNVPSIAEAGYPNASYPGWLGFFVPAKTPRDIVNRLNQEVNKALATPEMKEQLAQGGLEAWTMSPDEFDAMRRREFAENERLFKNANSSAK